MKKAYFPTENTRISKWLEKQFGIVTVTEYNECDVVVFPGGLDVDPNIYNEPAGQRTSFNRRTDESWVNYYKDAMSNGKKVIGICKGSQFLTTMAGATLYQHVNHHALPSTHPININGEIHHVTSTHHQMMNPFVLEAGDFELLAFSDSRRSDVYLNGYDDELAAPSKEPEAVFYKGNGALSIQFHPEFMDDNDPVQKVIKEWIDKTMEYKLETRFDRYKRKVDPNKKSKGGSIDDSTFDGKITKEIFDEFVDNYLK